MCNLKLDTIRVSKENCIVVWSVFRVMFWGIEDAYSIFQDKPVNLVYVFS